MPRRLLALEIGATTVKFVDVVSNSRQCFAQGTSGSILPISSNAIQDGEVLQPAALAADLKAGLKAAGVKTKHTALTVNSSRLILRQLDLPPLPIPQLRQLLTWELQRYTPYQADTTEFDLLSIQLTPKHHTVLLAAVPKSIVASLFMTVQSAGLYPFLLEPGVICLFRWIQYHYNVGNKNVVILDLGVNSSNILVVTTGQPFIARTVLVTLDRVEGKHKLIAEVRRSLDFVRARNNTSLTWYCLCTGKEASNGLLVKALAKDLKIPVQGLTTDSSLNVDSTLFATSLGLALGWWGGGYHRSE